MWRTILRAVIPILLMGAGIASLVYGAFYHRIQLVEQKTVKVKIPIPSPFAPYPPSGAAGGPMGQPPGGMPTFGFGEPGLSSDDVPSPQDMEDEEADEEETSPFETPAVEEDDAEEESPFETPAGDDSKEESPFESPAGGPPGQMPMGGANPFGPPGMLGGPPQFIEEEDTEWVKHVFSEPAVLREMTVGGVTRLTDGRLEWTNAGKGAAWCPT